MFWLLAPSPALAVDCTGLDPALCDAVDAAQLDINALTGEATIDDAAPRVTQRPQGMVDRLATLGRHLEASGCTVEGSAAGVYQLGGDVDGVWHDDNGGGGLVLGEVVPKRLIGAFVGDAEGDLGAGYGTYNGDRQFVASWGGGFLAGRWTRLAGNRGFWYGVHGRCDGPLPSTLRPWFRKGDLPPDPLRIFASSPWLNPLEGLGAMDAQCQADADAWFGPGQTTFLAAATDQPSGIDTPAQRFPPDRGLVLSEDGRWVSASVADFFDYTRAAFVPLDVTADGVRFDWVEGQPDAILWWGDFGPTAPLAGSAALGHGDCAGWTDPTMTLGPIGGQPATTLVRTYGWGASSCADVAALAFRTYCVEAGL